ncbi:oxygen-independent coproporphyrinogen-3 oxidase [Sinomicrobium oceani]|uniref:Heme chaperone HemW n=2 Tax=Sinomicrobium oceani TaxID=1150368 RepID=A0A1K1NGF0_9FLAO|nr:oxygen-independent coproporphyrinogen-3 oxidase [Sinomicrobium oceani]
MLRALKKELYLRKGDFEDEIVETVYFGGGTPSILSVKELQDIIDTVYAYYKVEANPEITVEANPDDLSDDRIMALGNSAVNRLSIGIQSFFDEDLKWMNRAHNGEEARRCLATATGYFDNITIDLIYGVPGTDHAHWRKNLELALSYGIPHISAYALTVEPRTALDKFIRDGKTTAPDEIHAREQFLILTEVLQSQGFIHYELSNFGKEGYFSRNNTSYWLGKKYLGIGPSAHSYDGVSRSWNVANNAKYLKALDKEILPGEKEELSLSDRYNEYVMTGLRTIWGVSLKRLEEDFGAIYYRYLLRQAAKHLDLGLLELQYDVIRPTARGKFLTDGIASDLFYVD